MLAKMNSDLSPLFLAQLTNLHKAIVRDFKAKIAEQLKHDGYDFATVLTEARAEAEKRFKTEAGGAYHRSRVQTGRIEALAYSGPAA
jgi:hypothetical protein